MRFLALATDYDGTVAHDGAVDAATLEALKRFLQSGRKLILVTGRELAELEEIFPHLNLFARVVAENGAVLFDPATHEKRVLAPRPPEEFIAALRARRVADLSVGDAIVATWHPYEQEVLESIRQFGLDLQVIFNKDAVMVLAAGVNKMFGLNHALAELKLSRHNIAGVGDAENDHSFLNCCACSAAVSNAIPALKERVDWVTEADHGAGVAQLIERILEDDLRSVPLPAGKHGILFGRENGRDVYLAGSDNSVLLCGQSGGGKSTFVAGFIERLIEREYQVCLIDPEGDYENQPGFVMLGDKDHPPAAEQVLQLIDDPKLSVIVNLVSLKLQDRPGFFGGLFAKILEKRGNDGRPHWIVVDEAHHLLPVEWAPSSAESGGRMANLFLVTVHPDHVAPAVMRCVNTLAVIGKDPEKMAEAFAKGIGIAPPAIPSRDLDPGEAAVWFRDSGNIIASMESVPGKAERKRHRRKYAEGELEPERVFYFRGPEKKLNLRVQNLTTFLQIAGGVDDETWLHHLRQGDYSYWLTRCIKDEELGEEVKRVEQDESLTPAESRQRIARAIEARYTVPA